MEKIAVIGSGSWGTGVCHLLGGKGYQVALWSFDKDTPAAINETHRNPLYLTDVELPNTWCSTSFEEVVSGAAAIVVVCPSAFVRTTVQGFAPFVGSDTPVVVLSKGIEAKTGMSMVEVIADVLGNPSRIAALSGPNHAEEVSHDMIAATVVASESEETALFFQELFHTSYFRVYTTSDVRGVELCAAAKNIIAIANGMVCAMGLGDDASAALMTRGLAEMSRLVDAIGGDPRTVVGLAGVGDLIVTCTSRHSRNRALGECLVAGGTLEEYQARTHMVAEGAVACVTVTDVARTLGVELPIAEAVRSILAGELDPRECIPRLLDRPLRPELDE